MVSCLELLDDISSALATELVLALHHRVSLDPRCALTTLLRKCAGALRPTPLTRSFSYSPLEPARNHLSRHIRRSSSGITVADSTHITLVGNESDDARHSNSDPERKPSGLGGPTEVLVAVGSDVCRVVNASCSEGRACVQAAGVREGIVLAYLTNAGSSWRTAATHNVSSMRSRKPGRRSACAGR